MEFRMQAEASSARRRLGARKKLNGKGLPRNVLRAEMAADLKRVARLCGLPDGVAPPVGEYIEHGRFGFTRIAKINTGERFHWSKGVNALGFRTVEDYKRNPTVKEVIADLWRVAATTSNPFRLPTVDYYNEHGRICYETVIDRLKVDAGAGAWARVAEVAGMAQPATPKGAGYTNDDFRAAYIAMAQKQGMEPGGYGPGNREFADALGVSRTMFQRRFGSWTAFVKICGFDARPRAGIAGPRRYGAKYVPCHPRRVHNTKAITAVHAFSDGRCKYCGRTVGETKGHKPREAQTTT